MAEARREIHYRFALERPQRRHRSTAVLDSRPRITRLLALAISWDHGFREGRELDGKVLAQLGRVSRSRITQIGNLLHLAPDIQERILQLPALAAGREPITEKSLRRLAGDYDWARQREKFEALMGRRIAHPDGNR